MKFQNMVVAFDGSEQSLLAVKRARELVETIEGSRMTIVSVSTHPNAQLPANFDTATFDPQQYLLSKEDILDLYNKTIADEKAKIMKKLDGAIDGMDEKTVRIEVVPGYTPANDIITYAERTQSDLIIMGSRGLGAIRGVLGSVSYAVLRESTIPVLVVK